MEKQKTPPSFKAITILFCLLAILSFGVFYYSNGMENKTESESIKKVLGNPALNGNALEKETILVELKLLKKHYDEIIFENQTMSLELIKERDKVMELMTDLVDLKDTKVSLDRYKNQVKTLQNTLTDLTVENGKLKEQNISIKKQNVIIKEQRDITEKILKETQSKTEVLKRDLQNTVEKGSKLEVTGATVVSYRLKNSGELIVTDKANKVDGINISFMITKNEIAKAADKVYYIQVVDSKNVVLGDISEGVHQYKSLKYSMAVNVSYERKTIRVSENFLGNKYVKGTYYVNIYDNEELVEESTFVLK
ncbi:hypothetical protein [Flavobacterium adhaerens]|uniref:hypothetical protein n=1 Tax=Flavobacterium adhaerens TaxID=3149043 RepID=UPI0032B4BE89